MKVFALIISLAAVLVPTAKATSAPLSDLQLSRTAHAVTPASDVQLSRRAQLQQAAGRYANARFTIPVSDVQLSRYGGFTTAPAPLGTALSSNGFNWGDAAIGALVTLAALLLAAALTATVRTHGGFHGGLRPHGS